MEEVMNNLEVNWNIRVVAITLDAGGEALKGCKMACRKYPHLVILDCFGHQVSKAMPWLFHCWLVFPMQTNLIVGDFFKSDTEFLQYTNKATELIGWLWDKTYILALLHEIQLLRDQYFHFFSWLLAVTRPPLTILTWPLESQWLFTNTCSSLTVTWTSWVSSTSPLLIYSSAWLVPRHAWLISLLS